MRALFFVFLAACDLQPLNMDTGTLEKLRIVHIAQDADGGVLHIVDKEANPRDVHVSIGMCAEDCPIEATPEDALVASGTATRIADAAWEFHFDLQPFFDAGRQSILVSASDGVTHDQAFTPYQPLAMASPAPFDIVLDATTLAPKGTYSLTMDPLGSVRWYVSANAILGNRKAQRTTLDLLRAKSGERVYVFAVTQSGLGEFRAAAFDVR
jgi:hypothetical protein